MNEQEEPTRKKCGRRCQYYGSVGGYSVQCKECNKAQSKQRRAASQRRMAAKPEGNP